MLPKFILSTSFLKTSIVKKWLKTRFKKCSLYLFFPSVYEIAAILSLFSRVNYNNIVGHCNYNQNINRNFSWEERELGLLNSSNMP